MPTVSIITPVFNEEESLGAFAEAIKHVLFADATTQYEVILVDDGSRDRSWSIMEVLAEQDSRFKAVALSRNMGSHAAIAAGMSYAAGDAAATLACDLQDPPEVVREFVARWQEGFEVVWGTRRSRQDTMWKRWTSKIFEGFLRRHAMPRGSLFATGSFLLMDRKVLDHFNRFREHNRITFALVAWLGFRQVQVPYDRVQRLHGQSGWRFKQMIKVMYDAFIGFSAFPVRVVTLLSFVIFLGAIPTAAFVLYQAITGQVEQLGWSSTILTVTLFGALLTFNTALILEYLSRIYVNTTERPVYFVAKSVGVGHGPHPGSP